MRKVVLTLKENQKYQVIKTLVKTYVNKKVKNKHDNLVKLGIEKHKAWQFANTRKSYWIISNSPILAKSLNNKTLERLGYISLSSVYC